MRRLVLTVLIGLVLLAACNLGSSATATLPAIITPTLTPAVKSPTTPPVATATSAVPPTTAPTPTFPPVITATPPPATATPTHAAATTKAPGLKLSDIHMLDTSKGWAIGQANPNDDLILKTADGGKTWKSVTPPEPSRSGKKAVAFFQDANHAWVNYGQLPSGTRPADFTVWRTSDGGATWKAATTSLSGLTFDGFTSSQIGFFDANNGWLWSVLGVGMSHTYIAIYKTSDAGATWKLVVSPDKNNLNMSCGKSGVWFRDANHGYIAGDCGGVIKGLYLYQTADGGTTWTELKLPAPASMPAAYTQESNVCGADTPRFFDAQKGLIVVRCTDMNTNKSSRWVYQTKDGGSTWTSAAMPRPDGGFFFLNASTGWYLGQLTPDNYTDVKVYTTADGGKTWKDVSGTHWGGQMDYLDAKNGWVIAKTGSDVALVRTADGGLTYSLLTPLLAP